MEFQTAEMPFFSVVVSLHTFILYHLSPSRDSMTFLLTGTHKISNEQKQDYQSYFQNCLYVSL